MDAGRRKKIAAALVCIAGAYSTVPGTLAPLSTALPCILSSPVVLAPVARDRNPAPQVRLKQSAWWKEIFDEGHTDPAMFRAEARLDGPTFTYVLKAIRNDPSFKVPHNVGSRGVPVDKQLMVFLLRIGSANSSSVAARRVGISPSTVPSVTRRVAKAIMRCLGPKHMEMPLNGTAQKAKVKALFMRRQFGDAIGIIDCTHANVVVPTHLARKGHASAFVCRKGRKSLVRIIHYIHTLYFYPTFQHHPTFLWH